MRVNKKLIYDIGMHNGADTAFYLRKGFSVIAVEANPLLVKQAQTKFEQSVREKRLIILNVGVSNKRGVQKFWINEVWDEWSSFVKEVGCRDGASCHAINVKCVLFKDIIKKYGIPYYLKIDIEKNDIYCLLDLDKNTLPSYISIEAHSLEYLLILYNLGYKHFKVIDQLNHNRPTQLDNENPFDINKRKRDLYWFARNTGNKLKILRALYKKRTNLITNLNETVKNWQFPPGSSGPFAEDTFGDWQNLEDTIYNWLHVKKGYGKRGTLDNNSWFDFHAKKSSK